MAVAALGALCDPPTKSTEISRERAIEIARQEVSLDADSVEAVSIDSKVAYKTLRQWFKRPYVRALQYGAAEEVVTWRVEEATVNQS